MSKVKYLIFLSLALTLLVSGCKKGTKLEPAVEKAPTEEKQPEQTPSEPPRPVQEQEVTKRDVEFQMIHFDFDKYNLRSDAIQALNANAQVLMDNPEVKIRIEGHCDERGTTEYNLALGEKRAQAAKDYLVKLGVASSRIEIITYGKERPIDPRANEEAWAKNRRDEFKVVMQ